MIYLHIDEKYNFINFQDILNLLARYFLELFLVIYKDFSFVSN